MARFPQVRWAGAESPVVVQPDVVVVRAADVLEEADRDVLLAGAGLVVRGGERWDLSVRDLLATLGIVVDVRQAERATVRADIVGMVASTRQDLLARVTDSTVTELEGTVHAHLTLEAPAGALLRTGAGSVVAAAVEREGRRAVVIAVDLGEERAAHLVRNAATWAAGPADGDLPLAAPAETQDPPERLTLSPAWLELKRCVEELQPLQAKNGSVPDAADHEHARSLVDRVVAAVEDLAPAFPHDAAYLTALVVDLRRWAVDLGEPDFLDALVAFQPQEQRIDGRRHLVVFPMYTQNGSPDRHLEAVLIEVLWPDFVARLEAGDYSNKLFVPIRFLDFTAGYDTNSAVLFPETVAMREIPTFRWGAIFADREAARFRAVVRAAAATTGLALPPDAARLLDDQRLAEETFVMWDLIHDRTHMRGDLPFDPFMIKQRMPYFLYALEELRCDLTAFREAVALEESVPHARLVQYAVIFDRIFRFAITGSRVRNYDGLGGQLLFAWLHQHGVLHWTDNRLSIDWAGVPDVVLALGREIEDLYWRSIDRPKISHWLAAYELVSATVTPHPASVWAKGPDALPLTGPLKELTDAMMPDEFPLSMFYEALTRRIGEVVTSTAGITGTSPLTSAPVAG